MDELEKKAVIQEDKNLLDVHQAAELLDINEKELWGLVHRHKVLTHNIGGAFLRFKKSDIEELKNRWRIERDLFPKKERYFPHRSTVTQADRLERLIDFWHFNDFYIICSLLILALLYVIVSSQ